MTREKAINIVRNINQTDTEKEALATLIPELHESEDERIRKKILAEYKERLTIESVAYKNPECNKETVDYLEKAIAYLEKQKEHTLSTKETELNSIAFLEQLGYTCIPPSEQKPNIKSKSLAELREKVMDFFDSAELTEEVKIKDVTDGKCLFVYIDEDDGPVIGIGQLILRGMCDDIKQLI